MKKIIILALLLLIPAIAQAEWVIENDRGSVLYRFESFNDFAEFSPMLAEAARVEATHSVSVQDVMIRFNHRRVIYGSCDTDLDCVLTYPWIDFGLEDISSVE
jgi:hypothetical protein